MLYDGATKRVFTCFIIKSQQHGIRIDPPNIAVGPKNRRTCMVRRSLHHVPRENNDALTKPVETVFADHVTRGGPITIA